MTFQEYLISKKIDGKAFQEAEPELYESWDLEFGQMHPHSFTAQKLYLINPVRLKYRLTQKQESPKEVSEVKEEKIISGNIIDPTQIATSLESNSPVTETKPPQVSKPARPVFKPKPKTN